MSASVGRILIVDDEEMIRSIMLRHLTGRGHTCEAVGDGRHALALGSTGSFDLVLADVKMPNFDGLALTRELQRNAPSVPVVLVTGTTSFDTAVRAMRHGACDIVVKPFQFEALDQAVERALQRRRSLKDVEDYRRQLERTVEKQSETAAVFGDIGRELDMIRAQCDGLTSDFYTLATVIATASETRFGEPDGRTSRVRSWSESLAYRAGMEADAVRAVGLAALLRDVGRLSFPEPGVDGLGGGLSGSFGGAMDDREYPTRGAAMLGRIALLSETAQIVGAWRERWDGSGFPAGLREAEIPEGARVLAVAMHFEESLTRSAKSGGDGDLDDAAESLRVQAGYALDPDLVTSFLGIPAAELAVPTPA